MTQDIIPVPQTSLDFFALCCRQGISTKMAHKVNKNT
jgi:hypothetical protein